VLPWLRALLQGIWGSTPVGSATKKEISVGETAKRGQLARGQMATKKSSRRKKQRTPKTKRRKRPTKWPRYTLCMVFFLLSWAKLPFWGMTMGVREWDLLYGGITELTPSANRPCRVDIPEFAPV